jgi:hypothetical protein
LIIFLRRVIFSSLWVINTKGKELFIKNQSSHINLHPSLSTYSISWFEILKFLKLFPFIQKNLVFCFQPSISIVSTKFFNFK